MRPLSLLAALSALLLNSCYTAGDGKAPPLEELYFPTGLALDGLSQSDEGDGAPKYLYVANSDFDLQYRAGSMVSYDLDLLRKVVPQNCNQSADCQGGAICDAPGVEGIPSDPARVPSYYCVDPANPEPCGAFGARDQADMVLNPGRCKSVDPINPQDGSPSVLVDSVGIGAFATDAIWRANPNAAAEFPGRLFVPVRGDSTLHWIDVHDGKFACGQNGSDDNGCDDQHRAGESGSDNLYQLTQPAEPYALDATADGAFVAITNQTSGSVSLFANDWSSNGGPKLVNILSGLPLAPVGIAALPETVFANGARPAPGFLVAYRNAAQIDLLRVRSDAADTGTSLVNYTRYALREAATALINANSLGFDSRGIAIDDAERQKDYAACQAAAGDCGAAPDPIQCEADLTRCLRAVHQPAVYVASRAPASLLVGAMTADIGYPAGTSELPSFTDSIPLTFGPSRVIIGDVKVPGTAQSVKRDSAGPYELERRVFAVCFDSRRIFVYDPKRRLIDSIVSTGRGPYALAMDSVRGLAYLGHFTDSYLGVISLDQRFPQTYATIVASIGAPKAPRTSK
ncbi:MAG: hypothetical protein WDO74_19300 [Pseudomonadota bacterium]